MQTQVKSRFSGFLLFMFYLSAFLDFIGSLCGPPPGPLRAGPGPAAAGGIRSHGGGAVSKGARKDGGELRATRRGPWVAAFLQLNQSIPLALCEFSGWSPELRMAMVGIPRNNQANDVFSSCI